MGYSRLRRGRDGGPRYTAYYWDVRGRERSAGTFTRKRDADRAWRRAEARIADGRFISVASGRQRFARYVTEVWLPNHVMEANTRQGYTAVLEKFLLPAFGNMRLNEVMPSQVREFFRQQQECGVSANTSARCRTVLGAIFTTALNDQMIYFHPCAGVSVPVVAKRPLRILSADEVSALTAAIPQPQWRLLVEVAVETGLRWGELAELRGGDLQVASRTLTVARAVVELYGQHRRGDGAQFLVKAYPKGAEYRQLRLSPELTTAVTEHIAGHGLDRDDLLFAFPTAAPPPARDEARAGGEQREDPHGRCSHYNGGCRCHRCRAAYAHYRNHRRAAGKDRPRKGRMRHTDGHLPRDWFRKQVWYPALRRAGITDPIRIHDLRHTNASWMLAGGADLQTVRERLGHRSLRATERYLHTLPETGDKAIAALRRIRTTPAADALPDRRPEATVDGQLTVTSTAAAASESAEWGADNGQRRVENSANLTVKRRSSHSPVPR